MDSTDHTGSWTTVGVHGNVVEASWLAMVDALTYAALRRRGSVDSSTADALAQSVS